MTLNVATVDGEVFAKLIGRYPADDMLLFQVSEGIVRDYDDGKWSPLCRFRFVRNDDGVAYMEMFTISDVIPS